MEALSRFGKISNSSMRTLQDGSICCDVKFEREEATQKALSPGAFTINDVHLPIHHGHGTFTVRIMNVCSKTSDSVVHAICQSCGFLMKVERIDENTLNVFFGVENKSDAENILKRLNCPIMDDCNWSASLQSGDASASATSSEVEDIDDERQPPGAAEVEITGLARRLAVLVELITVASRCRHISQVRCSFCRAYHIVIVGIPDPLCLL